MRKTLISFVIALSTIGSAQAAPPESAKESFRHQGFTYVYEVKDGPAGRSITGIRYPDATPFTLMIKGGRVEGVSNGQPVTFSLSEARGAAKGAVRQ